MVNEIQDRDSYSTLRQTFCERLFYLERISEHLSEEVAREHMTKNLKWIWSVLKLNDIGYFSPNADKFTDTVTFPPSIYIRQINTFLAALMQTRNGDIFQAYHELACFIDNYRQNWRHPFNEWERFALRALIENMLPLIEMNEKQSAP